MTREPKTPRTKRDLTDAKFAELLACPIEWGYRRPPKGKRAKSGQWWRRHPLNLPIVDDSFAEIVNKAWPQPARRVVDVDSELVTIDEHSDSRRVMEAMEKCDPKIHEDGADAAILKAFVAGLETY